MVVVGGCGLEQFSVSPRPLGFGFWTKGLGPGLDKNYSGLVKTLTKELLTLKVTVKIMLIFNKK